MLNHFQGAGEKSVSCGSRGEERTGATGHTDTLVKRGEKLAERKRDGAGGPPSAREPHKPRLGTHALRTRPEMTSPMHATLSAWSL